MEEITLFQEKKISEIKLDIYGVPDLSNWPQIFEIQNTAQKCYYTIKQHEKVMCSVSGGYDSDIVLDLSFGVEAGLKQHLCLTTQVWNMTLRKSI